MPDDGEGIPDEGEGMPDDGEGIPDDGDGIPDDGDGIPDDGEGIPDEGDGMPDDGEPLLGEGMPPCCGPETVCWLEHAARAAALPAIKISWMSLLRIPHLRCREAATSSARPGKSL